MTEKSDSIQILEFNFDISKVLILAFEYDSKCDKCPVSILQYTKWK